MYSNFNSYVMARNYRTKPEWIVDLTGYGDGAEASYKANRKQRTMTQQDRFADGLKAKDMAGAVLFWLHGPGNDWPHTEHNVRPAIEHIQASLAGQSSD